MKHKMITFFALLGGAAVFCVSAAAQGRIVADIPFDFIVQQKTMPAGQYDVLSITTQKSVFELRGQDGGSIIANMTSNVDGNPDKPSLTFVHSGNAYVLAKVTPPNSTTAYGLSRASIERNLHHKLRMASMVSVELRGR